MTTDENAAGTLAPGSVVGGRFKIDRFIGLGGMGEVYAAHHTATSKVVALKLIRGGVSTSADQTRRFMREARAATAIAHPNVIEVYDVFEDDSGNPVMVMELLQGETLSKLFERRRALELHEVATLLVPAMRALQTAHERGIVHRDLKPDNVFLCETPSGTVTKVLDFGIAKVLDPARLGSETQGQVTHTGALLGTPHYMSHEQAMSEKTIDARADVWSMGVIVFEALTGRRPLQFDNLGQMYTAFLQKEVPSIGAYVPDLPAEIIRELDHCLAKHAADRAPTLQPLADALAKYTDPEVSGAKAGGRLVEPGTAPAASVETKSPVSTSLPQEPARRSRAGWVLAALLALGTVTFFSLRRSSTAAPVPAAVRDDPSTSAPAKEAPVLAPTSVASETPTRPVNVAPSVSHHSVQHTTVHEVASASAAPTVTASATGQAHHGIAEGDPYAPH